MTVQFGTVFATPRMPDGSSWAGLSTGAEQLICNAAAYEVRSALVAYVNAHTGELGGTDADQFVGSQFQQAVASVCGVALNWLQSNLSGPSMYANGFWEGDTTARWQTRVPVLTSNWVSDLSVNAGGGAVGWRSACGSANFGFAQVWNHHVITRDDFMGTVRVPFARIPAAALCSGWGWLPGAEGEGLIGATVHITTSGGALDCSGIRGHTLADYTLGD